MRTTHIALAIMAFLASCAKKSPTSSTGVRIAKTPVEVVGVQQGKLSDTLVFFATTFYEKRNVVTAPVAGFVNKVNIGLGDLVPKGKTIFEIQTRESRALEGEVPVDGKSLPSFGMIEITAPAGGIVASLEKSRAGDYVPEGSILCTIAEINDLAFRVNVPFELISNAGTGRSCTIVLPNSRSFKGFFAKKLTTINPANQTQTVLAKWKEQVFLPENMIVKVISESTETADSQIVPKSCVLTDEMMQDFWVMKLINDSTAVRVAVKTGKKNTGFVEIVYPHFEPGTKIISKGNYGLSDTALVVVEQKNK